MAKEITVDEAIAAADQQLGDDFDEVDQSGVESQAQPTASVPVDDDLLDREVPVDRLSGYYKQRSQQTGQPIRIRDLVEGASLAEEKIRQQGEAANAARDEARVLRAHVEAMRQTLAEMRNPPAPTRAPSYEDVGVRDPSREILDDPASYGRATAQLGARIARSEIDPKLMTLEQKLEEMKQKSDVMDIRMAADAARADLEAGGEPIDSRTWQNLGAFLYAAAGGHPAGPKNPQAWKDAYMGLKEVFPQSTARATRPVEGIVRGNPTGSARTVPTRAPQLTQRVRGLINSVEEEAIKAGLPPEIARKNSLRAEEKLQARERGEKG